MEIASTLLSQNSRSLLNDVYGTLICAALFVLLLSQRGTGFLLVYVVPVGFCVWVAFAAYRVLVRKLGRGFQPLKAAIWVAAAVLATSVHVYRSVHVKGDAMRISEEAESFFKAHGSYPCSVRQLGIEESADRDHRHLANLYCLEGQPHLWYFNSFRPYEMEEYDFRLHAWGQVDATPD